MANIHVLPDNIVNLIAAGEVIDRPASVVKELVENALDAGATKVTVETKGGGKDLIRVVDNGSGISKENLTLAIRRHATSKLSSADQLWSLHTFGFRGEALASICQVAKVELASKSKDAPVGYALRVSGGKPDEIEAASLDTGTRITVEELFYNTPARAKYLKQQSGENRWIIKTVQDIALASPQTAITLIVDGQTRLETPGNASFVEVAAIIYGSSFARNLRTIDFANAFGTVKGWVGKPGNFASSRNQQTFAVNGRLFEHSPFVHVVENAYRGLLPIRRFPVFLLELSVEPASVDVNVHPAKRQVKFQYEDQIRRLLYSAVKELLSSPQNMLPEKGQPHTYTPNQQPQQALMEVPVAPVSRDKPLLKPTAESADQTVEQSADFAYLGQLYQTYLVWIYQGDLVIMDQHAAHERILFEQIISSLKERGSLDRQELLIPQTMQFSPGELEELLAVQQGLERLGFALEEFGPNCLLLRGIPSAYSLHAPKSISKETILELAASVEESKINQAKQSPEEWDAAKITACKGAVKAGDYLDRTQAVKLLHDWLRLGIPTCPHGRPIIRRFDQAELAKMFLRN